jgi:poly [ADP-ribose] polymerase 2/3/4
MKSPIELIMVTGENNNKFYRMVDSEDGNFKVEYGRVGVTSVNEVYPISRWDSKYKEKIKKGYRDVSDLKATIIDGKIQFNSTDVEHFYTCFSKYTRENVSRNYTIQVGAVTKLMVDEAQGIINELLKTEELEAFNKFLLQLYMVLPRRMGNVRDHLFTTSNLQAKENPFKKKIGQEQDVLDSLSSQIITQQVSGDQTIEDLLGVKIELVVNPQWIDTLINPTNSSRHKPHKTYKITHPVRQQKFNDWLQVQDNKNTELLIHGTRNPNIFSILKAGLLIRPTNAVISGAAYGEGVYHSAHTDKSLGYTGYDPDKIFLIQNVHMGNPYVYEGWYREGKGISRSQMNYNHLKSIGNDSLYVKPGDGLRNSEYIVFNMEQTNTEFLCWMK